MDKRAKSPFKLVQLSSHVERLAHFYGIHLDGNNISLTNVFCQSSKYAVIQQYDCKLTLFYNGICNCKFVWMGIP